MKRRRELPPIAPFRRATDIYALAGRLLQPKPPITVSAWAVANMGYDPEVLPWQPEIMDALGAGGDVDLMGPAQIGKSEIGLAWWGWSIDHSPADFLICQPDKAMMQDFVVRRMEPMVDRTKALKAALLDRNGADNIFMKRFGGMISAHIWPVAAQFRSRPVPRGWLDDYDQIPEDIEGQGSAHALMGSRQTWFEGRSGTFTSSSPANPAGGGIEARVLGGTCEHLHPACPSCGERFAIAFDKHLAFDRTGTPDAAEASAKVICPSHGCVLGSRDRRALLASCTTLPNGGFVATFPAAKRRTFAVDGLMGIRAWGLLARDLRAAEIAWESRQDESELRAAWNTKGGKNYRSRLAGEKRVETADLVKRREGSWKLGTVPPGVKVLVASVDIQGNRFEIAITGFGDGLESWFIDRFDIHVLDDGITPIDPASCPEHWSVLTGVLGRRYPLAGNAAVTVPILAVAVDTGGEKGVQPNAVAWWKSAVALGIAKRRIALVKGGNHFAKLAVTGTFLDKRKNGGFAKGGPQLWLLNTTTLKNMWDARLRRTVPGPGYVHLPADYDERHLDELTAEELRGGKWVKVRPRNETLDCAVYASAAIMRPGFAQSRSDMAWVPLEFRVPDVADAAVVTVSPLTVPPIAAPPMSLATADIVPFAAPPPRAAVPRGVNALTGRARGSFLRRG